MCAVLDTPFETFDNLDFEDRIHRAFEESIEQQTCLPLIKQELQCKIQCDRLSRGESELVLDEEPQKSYEVRLSKLISMNSLSLSLFLLWDDMDRLRARMYIRWVL